MSPVVLRINGYAFRFYSSDRREPPHVHVEAGENAAKFWLAPVSCAWSSGYNVSELNEIRRLVEENESYLVAKWREYFAR